MAAHVWKSFILFHYTVLLNIFIFFILNLTCLSGFYTINMAYKIYFMPVTIRSRSVKNVIFTRLMHTFYLLDLFQFSEQIIDLWIH